MLDLVRRVCGRWRILAIVDRLLVVLLLRLPFGAVMSNCPSRYRSSNQSSTSCPSPHTHENSLLSWLTVVVGSAVCVVTLRVGFVRRQRDPGRGPDLEYPMSLGVYDKYLEAQRVVDTCPTAISGCRTFAIVGTELRSVERVTGRPARGNVAAAGAMSGPLLGLFGGIAYSLFGKQGQLGFLISTPVLGALFGLVWIQIGFAAVTRRGTRDFASVSQVVATKYEVLIEHHFVSRARDLLATMPAVA
jgi:hypothetical protein